MKVLLVVIALANIGPMAPTNDVEIKELPSMAACQAVAEKIQGLATGTARPTCIQVSE